MPSLLDLSTPMPLQPVGTQSGLLDIPQTAASSYAPAPAPQETGLSLRDKLGLAFANMAAFDRGGINMPAAIAATQQAKDLRRAVEEKRQKQGTARQWIEQNAPELMPQLDAGADPMQLMISASQERREAKKREQYASLISDPAKREAFLGGLIDFGEASKTTEAPNSYQEYQFAQQQGYDKPYVQFMQEKGRQTTYNIPAPPSGYRNVFDDSGNLVGQEPVPGGPAALEQQEAERQAELAKQNKNINANVVVQDIDRALQKIAANPGTTTGPGGALFQNIPGTEARNVKALTDTIRANTGFDKLQAMRDASPTGGALGQVSEQENRLLQAAIGNLELAQNEQQLSDNLKRVKNIYLDTIHGPGGGPPREALGFEGGPDDDEIEKLLEKYGN